MLRLSKDILQLVLGCVLLLTLNPNLSYASGSGTPPSYPNTPPPGTQPGGGTCDWTEFKKAVASIESDCCGGYQASAAPASSACGKYQFLSGTAKTVDAYKNGPSECKFMCSKSEGFASNKPQCNTMQEKMMDEFSMKNLNWLKANCPAAVNALGTTIHGYDGRGGGKGKVSCTLTWSGLLGGAHYQGAPGICNKLSKKDDSIVGINHISPNAYMCETNAKPVPDTECNPKEYPTTETGPIGPTWEGDPPGGNSRWNTATYSFFTLSEALKHVWVGAFQLMTSQLTTIMVQQVQVIGTFFDAKHQLETQRLMQQKFAEAHKDYHPSKQMCEIGTFVRNLADSEKRADLTQAAMARSMLDRALASGNGVQTFITGADDDTRLRAYIDRFCNIKDNAEQNDKLCGKSASAEQINADINFTQTIDAPLTLGINLLDDTATAEETTLFTFIDYIFMHDTFPWMAKHKTLLHKFIPPYQEMRSLVAMRSVAQNSFAQIIAQKTQGPDGAENSVAPFLKALMKEMGMKPTDIEKRIGKHPSYYAQMEILTKKIYQHPEFIANLYDKPVNVKRIRAAMTAIKLMQDRDIHEALLRREMLMSMLLELKLREQQQDLNNREIQRVLDNKPFPPYQPSTTSVPPPAGSPGPF